MILLRHSYVKNDLKRDQSHIRYIAFRTRENREDTRGVFNALHDHADVKTFINNLNDRITRHPRSPKLHRIYVSLSQDEYSKLMQPDYKNIVRQAIAEFERRKGIKLEWVAAEHYARGHPHVHIAIKATYTDLSGAKHHLLLRYDDIKMLRSCFDREVDRYRDHLREAVEKAVREIIPAMLDAKRSHQTHLRCNKLEVEKVTGTGFSLVDAVLGIEHDYEEER